MSDCVRPVRVIANSPTVERRPILQNGGLGRNHIDGPKENKKLSAVDGRPFS
jgi:hypothetical protein